MLTSKQRAYLRAKANGLAPVLTIGKNEIEPPLIHSALQALAKRELIKARVLPACLQSAGQIGETLAAATQSELVCVTGNTFVLFRQKQKDSAYTLPRENA